MTAPWMSNTASQWPPSISVSVGLAPPKAWFTAIVVRTKPNQTKSAADQPAAHGHIADMAHQARQHPGHDEQGDDGDDEGQGLGRARSALQLVLRLADGGSQGFDSTMYQIAPRPKPASVGYDDREIVHP